MHAWAALPSPLGKERLLELGAATAPLFNPPWLWWEAKEAFDALAIGAVDIDTGMAAVRASIAERTAAGLRGDGRSRVCGLPRGAPPAGG